MIEPLLSPNGKSQSGAFYNAKTGLFASDQQAAAAEFQPM